MSCVCVRTREVGTECHTTGSMGRGKKEQGMSTTSTTYPNNTQNVADQG